MGLTDSFIDRRNEEFADYIQCDASLVQELNVASKTAVIPDPEEAQEIAKTVAAYANALKHLERFEEALTKLPDIERGVFQIQKDHWSEAIPSLKEGLLSSMIVAQKRIGRGSGQGRANHKANAIAEFVAQVFEKLNRPITFGISGHDNGPSTDFGKAVQKCLTIYNVRSAPKKTIHYARSITKPVAPLEVIENGNPADWRRPTQAAYMRRKLPNA